MTDRKLDLLYARETALAAAEFRAVLEESGLGSIRPVGNEERLARMLSGADLVVGARLDGRLVGVARCITDFSWVCYLSDLAVSSSVQGLGVGKGLVEAVRRETGPEVALALISVPDATGFYERIGMTPIDACYWFGRER